MKFEERVITPEEAEGILSFGAKNRSVVKSHVLNLAGMMSGGMWNSNSGQPIVFDDDNRLIDGQHRLLAVIDSGVPTRFPIIRNADPGAFMVIDTGRKRSPSDVLSIKGYINTSCLAAAATLVLLYPRGMTRGWKILPPQEVVEFIDENPAIVDSVSRVKSCLPKIMSPGLAAALHYLFSRFDQDAADEFIDAIVRGSGLEQGDPFLVLRESLIRNSIDKRKIQARHMAALAIKAWNFKRDGKRIVRIAWHPGKDEPFPVIK